MFIWSAYSTATGIFTGRRKSSSVEGWEPADATGLAWMRGEFDRDAQRVDLETGLVIEYSPPPPPLEQLKYEKWEAMKRERDLAQFSGFNVNGIGTFQSDPDSQRLIIGAVVQAQIALANSAPFSVTWTLADNSSVVLNATAMIGVGLALGAHIDYCFVAGRAARGAIEAAVTAAEVAAVEF